MNRRFLFSVLLVALLATIFWYSHQLQNEFYQVVNFFKDLVLQDEQSAMMVFVLLAALAALISPLTNIPLVPFAVAIWGSGLTTILLLVGWLVGDVAAYLAGRYLGYSTIAYLFSRERIDTWSETIKKHTTPARAFFVRLVFPAELGYAFGIVKFDLAYYLAITFLAELPFAIVSAYASEAVLAGEVAKFSLLVGFLLLLVYGGFRMLHKR